MERRCGGRETQPGPGQGLHALPAGGPRPSASLRPGPASSDPSSGRPALPRAPRGGGSGPTADPSPRPRLRAGGPGRGGGRPASWTPDPGVAAAASFKLAIPGASFPASPTVPSPRLTSRAASEQEGGGEHEQEKQKQAREEPHGAVRPVPCRRPESSPGLRRKWRYFSSGLRAGRGGARTTHGPSPRPFLWPRSAVHVATSRHSVEGCAGRSPGGHVAGCWASEIPRRSRLPRECRLAT